jgi:hypothetical protein
MPAKQGKLKLYWVEYQKPDDVKEVMCPGDYIGRWDIYELTMPARSAAEIKRWMKEYVPHAKKIVVKEMWAL